MTDRQSSDRTPLGALDLIADVSVTGQSYKRSSVLRITVAISAAYQTAARLYAPCNRRRLPAAPSLPAFHQIFSVSLFSYVLILQAQYQWIFGSDNRIASMA